jgi:LAO/AO transport system kinase
VTDVDALVASVVAGRRRDLGRAITLVESSRPADRPAADALLHALAPRAGGAFRIGLTGVPGVGKSTLIEAFGRQLIEAGHRVGVLAVDPSSVRSGGSILGDKTRMTELAKDPQAFIRPTPAAGTLGGVARHTREAITVLEAAGYDVVLVETVGVGQSEVMVAHMVDAFVVLALAGGGDELQGIKRGILELCDVLAVTKADGDNVARAQTAAREYASALRLIPPRAEHWTPRVQTCSAVEGAGLDELWDSLQAMRTALTADGTWEARRADQRVHWMWQALDAGLSARLRGHPAVQARLPGLEAAVRDGAVLPDAAAGELLELLLGPE